MVAKQRDRGGVNLWNTEEDIHLETFYTGYASIPEIARALKRTESSVAHRVAITIAGTGNKRQEDEKKACLLHSLDLMKSGGRFK
jgi:hypothetical protein